VYPLVIDEYLATVGKLTALGSIKKKTSG